MTSPRKGQIPLTYNYVSKTWTSSSFHSHNTTKKRTSKVLVFVEKNKVVCFTRSAAKRRGQLRKYCCCYLSVASFRFDSIRNQRSSYKTHRTNLLSYMNMSTVCRFEIIAFNLDNSFRVFHLIRHIPRLFALASSYPSFPPIFPPYCQDYTRYRWAIGDKERVLIRALF